MGKTLTQLVQEITRSNQLQDSQALQIANSQTLAAKNPKRLVGQYALSTALSKAFNVQAGSPRF